MNYILQIILVFYINKVLSEIYETSFDYEGRSDKLSIRV